jgi:hypothetical protein
MEAGQLLLKASTHKLWDVIAFGLTRHGATARQE